MEGSGSLKSRGSDIDVRIYNYTYSICICTCTYICTYISSSICQHQYTHLYICDWVPDSLPGGGDVINGREKKRCLCHSLLHAGPCTVSCIPWPKDQYWKQEGGQDEPEGRTGGKREERKKMREREKRKDKESCSKEGKEKNDSAAHWYLFKKTPQPGPS